MLVHFKYLFYFAILKRLKPLRYRVGYRVAISDCLGTSYSSCIYRIVKVNLLKS